MLTPGVLPIFQPGCYATPRLEPVRFSVGSDVKNDQTKDLQNPRYDQAPAVLSCKSYISTENRPCEVTQAWHLFNICFSYVLVMIVMSTFREKCQLSMNSPKKLLHWSSWSTRRGSNVSWAKFAVCWLVEVLWRRLHWYIPPIPRVPRHTPIRPIRPIPSPPCILAPESLARARVLQWSIPCLRWCDRLLHIGALDLQHLLEFAAGPGGLRAAGLPTAGPPASRVMLKQADGFPEVRVYATPLASTGHVTGRCWIFWSPCSSCSMPPGMIIISHPSWQGNHWCFVSLQYAWTYCRKADFGESSVVTHASHTHLIFVGLNTPGRYHSKWNFGGLAWSAGQLATGVLRQFAWLGGGQACWPPTFARPWPPWGSPWRGWASGVELGQ